jgi:hypothetical protein
VLHFWLPLTRPVSRPCDTGLRRFVRIGLRRVRTKSDRLTWLAYFRGEWEKPTHGVMWTQIADELAGFVRIPCLGLAGTRAVLLCGQIVANE